MSLDSVGVGLAAFGLLNPVLAALIQVSSELLFIMNSARLLSSSATDPDADGEIQPGCLAFLPACH
jgi:Cd2+/Zn2+-exporting ATPase/Cu+-exporting ATPase